MNIMFQSEIKTSGFDTKVENFTATDPPLPGANSFIQSRGRTGCIYHLAQSWVCCWLFGCWVSKPQVSLSLLHCKVAVFGSTAGQGGQLQRGTVCPAAQHPGVCTTSQSTGSVCSRRMEAVLPKGVPESLCAGQTSLWACSECSKWGKGWCIISFPSQTSYYCFGQFIPLRMHKANKPCSP